MLRGYTSRELLEAELGTALTDAQVQYANDTLIEQAERLIDAETGRTWLAGAITEEAYYGVGGVLRLRTYPVASIESLSARDRIGGTDSTLVAGTDYELHSPSVGLVWLRSRYSPYSRVLASYTPVDAEELLSDSGLLVRRAATLLVLGWLRGAAGDPSAGGDIKSYSIPGDLSVTFRDAAPGQRFPSDVQLLLDRLKPGLAFA